MQPSVRRAPRVAAGSAPAARSKAGSRDTDPRHRRGSRSPSRRAVTSFWPKASFSPAATRIICSTRSSPVTILGHRMLDLEPGVHLEEVEALAGRIGAADDQLDRARAVIADRAGERDRLLAHRLAHLGRDEGRRRFLDHLLVAALDRAFALAEIDDVAVLIAEHLDLDVARMLDELLDEHAVVAEAGQALALGRLEALAHVLLGPGEPHALAAAAGRGLHHHRIADVRRRSSPPRRWSRSRRDSRGRR